MFFSNSRGVKPAARTPPSNGKEISPLAETRTSRFSSWASNTLTSSTSSVPIVYSRRFALAARSAEADSSRRRRFQSSVDARLVCPSGRSGDWRVPLVAWGVSCWLGGISIAATALTVHPEKHGSPAKKTRRAKTYRRKTGRGWHACRKIAQTVPAAVPLNGLLVNRIFTGHPIHQRNHTQAWHGHSRIGRAPKLASHFEPRSKGMARR